MCNEQRESWDVRGATRSSSLPTTELLSRDKTHVLGAAARGEGMCPAAKEVQREILRKLHFAPIPVIRETKESLHRQELRKNDST